MAIASALRFAVYDECPSTASRLRPTSRPGPDIGLPCGSASDTGFEPLRCCLQSSEDGREATRFRHVARQYGVGVAVVLGKRPKPVVSMRADVVV
jgi:hypothetical protein